MSDDTDDEDDFGPNPGFNRPVRRNPEAEKAALRQHFKANGTPEERPAPEHPTPSSSRSTAMAEIAAMHADNERRDAARTSPMRNTPELER